MWEAWPGGVGQRGSEGETAPCMWRAESVLGAGVVSREFVVAVGRNA